MAADFFDRQDVARRNTTRLVVLFAAAVVGMIAAIDLLLAGVFGYLARDPRTGAIDWALAANPQVLLLATAGTLLVVAGGSIGKIAQLRGGGRVVAEHLGGRRLSPDTTEPAERRLLNVVDEMAIASGVPAPPVYLMEREAGINAFAAGFAPGDAVIGVTRGTLEQLDRDELQGVVAHEFSHILNGDMRLNIRLMGLLHGILIVGMLGYFLLRMTAFFGHHGRRSRNGGNGLPLIALGAGLMVVGFVGTFFGNLIKAGVSRQREFLADASAVQFTRQPSGIAGALKKIGGFEPGATVRHPGAAEVSHMFFGRATTGLNSLFSTHPPLDERIRRLDPMWRGAGVSESRGAGAPTSPAASGFAGAGPAGEAPAASPVDSVGRTSEAHLHYASMLLAGLPPRVREAAHEPYGARALVYALLLDEDADARTHQLARLAEVADPDVHAETLRLLPEVARIGPGARLPLVDLALPALGQLTRGQYDRFRQGVVTLVEADGAITLLEWVLQRVLLRELARARGDRKPARVRVRRLAGAMPEIDVLLSGLAHAGHPEAGEAARAFAVARQALGAGEASMCPAGSCGLEAMDQALEALDAATPAIKRQVLQAAAACVGADARVTVAEAELLRAVSASLGCPMPPILGATGASTVWPA
jgi:Zn-dependent protease with chaperone function